jgi:hypothetical protein
VVITDIVSNNHIIRITTGKRLGNGGVVALQASDTVG